MATSISVKWIEVGLQAGEWPWLWQMGALIVFFLKLSSGRLAGSSPHPSASYASFVLAVQSKDPLLSTILETASW